MWYDSFAEPINPGRVLGEGIAQLYNKLKEDPSRYPKGINVRILLGNPPKFALLPTLNSQESALIQDLYAAGVPEMRNDEIGWKLEVARYSGSWPHSHTKLLIVDGKTVQAVWLGIFMGALPLLACHTVAIIYVAHRVHLNNVDHHRLGCEDGFELAGQRSAP